VSDDKVILRVWSYPLPRRFRREGCAEEFSLLDGRLGLDWASSAPKKEPGPTGGRSTLLERSGRIE
jgi:hypothetical protein